MEKTKDKARKFDTESFRCYLQRELTRRIERNNRFSLRAFSKLLKLDSGQLSRIISGTRKPSKKTVDKILDILKPGPKEAKTFYTSSTSRDEFKTLSLESFQVIADWYHYAILELSRIEEFNADPAWISAKLGISKIEAKIAIERLIRLKYLEEKNGRLIDVSGLITTEGNDFTASAFKQMQRQILEQAITALDDTPVEVRSQSSLTFAISSDDFEVINNKIQSLKKEIVDLVERDHVRTNVYQLSFSLFPLINN